MEKIKPITAWMITHKGQRGTRITTEVVSVNRATAIQMFLELFGHAYTWEYLKKDGYDVVKVRIEAA